MKTFITSIIVIMLVILTPDINYSQWQRVLNLPSSWSNSLAIDASDSNTVAISVRDVTPHSILFTKDGGKTWNTLPVSGINNYNDAVDISVIDSLHIWFGTDDGRIIATSNGGESWTVQFSNTAITNFINYIKMFDADKGIAMGDAVSNDKSPAILSTTNGGINWNFVTQDKIGGGVSGDIWRRIDFVNIYVGYFQRSMSPYQPCIYKTTDGGKHWNAAYQYNGLIVKAYNENLCLAGNRGKIERTFNGGNLWEDYSYGNNDVWENDIEFIPGDPSKIWLTNIGQLCYSADTGRTWRSISGISFIRDIVFTDQNHGWLLGDNGKLYMTSNNGGMITDVKEPHQSVVPSAFELYQNYPNPFNPTTVISYLLLVTGHVSLKVFDILGREVAALVNEIQQAGSYNIQLSTNHLPAGSPRFAVGAGRQGYQLSSGVYFYRLIAGNYSLTKKMVVLK